MVSSRIAAYTVGVVLAMLLPSAMAQSMTPQLCYSCPPLSQAGTTAEPAYQNFPGYYYCCYYTSPGSGACNPCLYDCSTGAYQPGNFDSFCPTQNAPLLACGAPNNNVCYQSGSQFKKRYLPQPRAPKPAALPDSPAMRDTRILGVKKRASREESRGEEMSL